MSGVSWISMTFHRMHSTGDRIICPTSCQHPSHRNSVGSRYEKTLFINSWSIHQENHPICLSTKPQIIEIPGNSQQIFLNSWTNLHQKIPWASLAVSRCTKARACVSCGAKESKVKAQKSPRTSIFFDQFNIDLTLTKYKYYSKRLTML